MPAKSARIEIAVLHFDWRRIGWIRKIGQPVPHTKEAATVDWIGDQNRAASLEPGSRRVQQLGENCVGHVREQLDDFELKSSIVPIRGHPQQVPPSLNIPVPRLSVSTKSTQRAFGIRRTENPPYISFLEISLSLKTHRFGD
jgi:hypothetical protein